MKQQFIWLLIIVIWGCTLQKNEIPKMLQKLEKLTVYQANTETKSTISFQKDAIYGDSKKTLIGKMGDLAVDSSGRVFIADVEKQCVHAFAADGHFITRLGRKGKGPGEFSYIKKLQIRNNYLYVSDANYGVGELSLFTLDSLTLDKTIAPARNRNEYKPLEKAYPGVSEIYVRDNSTFLAEFISHSFKPTKKWQNVEMKGLLYFLDSRGRIESNKLIEFKEEIRTYHLGLSSIEPFFGNAFTVLSSDNTIYWAGPEYLLIKEYSPEGTYQQAFYYSLKEIPLTKESAVKAGVNDYYIQNMKNMDLPPTWPVLTDMKMDDQDRFWIATTVEDMNVYQWWVLEKNGEVITKFDWPRAKPIEEVRNGYIYTRETDERGMETIVKYEITLDEG
jgi:hypothetical protein